MRSVLWLGVSINTRLSENTTVDINWFYQGGLFRFERRLNVDRLLIEAQSLIGQEWVRCEYVVSISTTINV